MPISLDHLLGAMGLQPGATNINITGLAYDSRKVKKGDLFFAIPGFKENGTKYIAPALAAGAAACIVQEQPPTEFLAQCYRHGDVREAMARAAAAFYSQPSQKMLGFGVTGTKGKTSTAFLIDSILTAAKHPTAMMGTVLCRYPGHSQPSTHTTMESLELQKFLSEAHQNKATAFVLEVSSHAISLHRSTAVELDAVLFTNLSQDHLDFYGDMENYFQAKLKLFTDYRGGSKSDPVGVTNIDDAFGKRVMSLSKIPVFGFGLKEGDYQMPDAVDDTNGIRGTLKCPNGDMIRINSPLTGRYNIWNIIGAAAITHAKGIDVGAIEQGITNLEGIPGRLERIPSPLPFEVYVDFAHIGTALENVLRVLRPLCAGRLIVLFGAGGDKPPDRRIQLGRAAAKLADLTWITSDNPRTEDPMKIIDTIVESFKDEQRTNGRVTTYRIEADRGLAIDAAVRDMRAGDIICIAGKGHQTEMLVGKDTFHFDDREEARRVLRALETERNP